MRIAKADLVPTAANLLGEYRTFAELEAACRQFTDEVNARLHRETRRRPSRPWRRNAAGCIPCPARRSPSRSAAEVLRLLDYEVTSKGGLPSDKVERPRAY